MAIEVRPLMFKPHMLNGLIPQASGQSLREQLRRRAAPIERDRGEDPRAGLGHRPRVRHQRLKREELIAAGSVILHEIYFDCAWRRRR